MNGYLFALVQVVIYFVAVIIYGSILHDLETLDVGFFLSMGFMYFVGICQGVFYMGRKGGGKV